MKKLKVFVWLFLIFIPSFVLSQTGEVIKVKDGDTIDIVSNGYKFTCRLYGIDAPETPKRKKPGQPYGNEATQELKQLILRQTVDIQLTGEKTYRREVCHITKDGKDINLEMVKRGYAWAYRHYLHGPYASEYIDAERDARGKRLGLWQDVNPLPPWEFRKLLKTKR